MTRAALLLISGVLWVVLLFYAIGWRDELAACAGVVFDCRSDLRAYGAPVDPRLACWPDDDCRELLAEDAAQ